MLVAVVSLLALSPSASAVYEVSSPLWNLYWSVSYSVKLVAVRWHICRRVCPVHPALRYYRLVEHGVDTSCDLLPDCYFVFCQLEVISRVAPLVRVVLGVLRILRYCHLNMASKRVLSRRLRHWTRLWRWRVVVVDFVAVYVRRHRVCLPSHALSKASLFGPRLLGQLVNVYPRVLKLALQDHILACFYLLQLVSAQTPGLVS